MSTATCDFSIIKSRDIKRGYANLYYLYVANNKNSQPIINPGTPIKFNRHENMVGIAMVTQDSFRILKKGAYELSFIINYANINNFINVGVAVNSVMIGESIGAFVPLLSGISQLSGKFTLRLEVDDIVQLAGLSNAFSIRQSNNNMNERIATFTIMEV